MGITVLHLLVATRNLDLSIKAALHRDLVLTLLGNTFSLSDFYLGYISKIDAVFLGEEGGWGYYSYSALPGYFSFYPSQPLKLFNLKIHQIKTPQTFETHLLNPLKIKSLDVPAFNF